MGFVSYYLVDVIWLCSLCDYLLHPGFLVIVVSLCQVLRCFVTGQIPCTPLLFAKYLGGMLVGYIGISILCVEVL